MLIAPAVLAAIISAIGGLASASANANKPQKPALPKASVDPRTMTGEASKTALETAGPAKPMTVADAYGAPAQAPGTGPGQGPGGLNGIDPQILALLAQMGGMQ